MGNDKLKSALEAVEAIDNDITMNAGQGSGPSLAIIRTALTTQAAVIEYLVLNMPVEIKPKVVFLPIIGRQAHKDNIVAAAFQAVEEECK